MLRNEPPGMNERYASSKELCSGGWQGKGHEREALRGLSPARTPADESFEKSKRSFNAMRASRCDDA